ncbi:hypothetical protein Tco_1231409 [Tanacetum coccineum]
MLREDLEQIDPDDLEEMDLQCEMAMLTIRARIHQEDKQAVGSPRNQENRGREINRRTVTVETPTENALVAQDRIGGYDWSYQAEKSIFKTLNLNGTYIFRSSSVQIHWVDLVLNHV